MEHAAESHPIPRLSKSTAFPFETPVIVLPANTLSCPPPRRSAREMLTNVFPVIVKPLIMSSRYTADTSSPARTGGAGSSDPICIPVKKECHREHCAPGSAVLMRKKVLLVIALPW